ncbi:MAG: transposase [Clostridiaceae bacterium]|nr:transposase [Clostridiaceae bacterium]
MTRAARGISENGVYHIMLRGINRQTIFEDDRDIERLIDTVKRYKPVSKYELYAYCIMSNHAHFLIKEVEEPVSISIKRISSSYVFWYNKKYDRCGHLFQERFKSEVIDNDEYFLTVLRYIHQNPVKAGIVKDISGYRWSSYSEYMGNTNIVDVDFVLDMFSPDRGSALTLFREFNSQQNNDMCMENNEKVKISDTELRKQLIESGIINLNEFRQLEKSHRDKLLKKLKSVKGVTIRQLSRITGISKGVIERS